MTEWLTWAVVALACVLLVAATVYAVRDRLIDDGLLAVAALLELGLLASLVTGLANLGEVGEGDDKALFVAYLVSVPLIPVGTAFLAIKEKSRWAMGSVAVGAFAVAVMMVRLQEVWNTSG